MAIVAMAELAVLNSAIGTPQRPRVRSGENFPKTPRNSRSHALARWNFNCGGGTKNAEQARRCGLGIPDVRWRTRAVARTPVEEGVADAKRAIDEVLRTAGNGSGLAEATWALYADEATKEVIADAVTKLGACRGQDFGEFLRSEAAQGVWEVFYAPHIFALSSAVGTQILPLQYVLSDSGFSSHARYISPVGEGWLSAAGDYVIRDGKTVEILFDSFWADGGRDNLQPDPRGEGTIQRTMVNIAGKSAFMPALSVYPVYYADADVTVFEFTALRTRIAARKIRPA